MNSNQLKSALAAIEDAAAKARVSRRGDYESKAVLARAIYNLPPGLLAALGEVALKIGLVEKTDIIGPYWVCPICGASENSENVEHNDGCALETLRKLMEGK